MIRGNRSRGLAVAAMLAVGLAAGPLQAKSNDTASGAGMAMMGGMETEGIPCLPPVAGYAEGDRILFVHTEASDVGIAGTLTEMMGSPVPVVPAFADAPDSMLANVYVFENRIQPEGPRSPLNYQPDVFDWLVGSDCYTPLRRSLQEHGRVGLTCTRLPQVTRRFGLLA